MPTEITPSNPTSLYAEERDRGKSDAEAAAAVGHAYNRRGVSLEVMLERPRREYEQRESAAQRPGVATDSEASA